ncbi:MAG: chemotaxis protein CheW [Pseudomonadota bacterium]
MTSLSNTQGSGESGANFDLTQFYQVFFEEAGESLAGMEQLLLELGEGAPDDEALNAVFRCAHSIKGGAATFGFEDVTSLTHVMETLLDKLRRHELAFNARMVDVLLASGDALRAMLAVHQGGGEGPGDVQGLIDTIQTFDSDGRPAASGAATVAVAAQPERTVQLLAGPLAQPDLADDLVTLFKEVGGLGRLERCEALPGQDAQTVRFKLVTSTDDDELLDLCCFHVPRDQLALAPWPQAEVDPGYGFFEPPPVRVAAPAPAPAPQAEKVVAAAAGETTIRVSVEKVDQLINLMGELVITRAVLAQRADKLELGAHQQLLSGLADLERTTRHLQDAVMSIRMIPMAVVFNRFPRMLRDLAGRLGKQVELKTVGEATELDKGLIEKITDPLTHLIRNALDHGIEQPHERVAAGKSAQGRITLSAQHSGGSILIEVRDDGKGLDRDRIVAKARANGMILPEPLTDQDVWQLIFAPGFSTAEVVTDVSGRGVGMDVVKRNILALGGSVSLDSVLGVGTRVQVRLPLTLAIMDGMTVGVGDEIYVLPLASVVESFQASTAAVKTLACTSTVVKVRDDWLPVVALESLCAVQRTGEAVVTPPIMVVVASEGKRVALLVDALLGQQQVVVKNLEANYRKVQNISGATIMGDGRVALILDVAALVQPDSH